MKYFTVDLAPEGAPSVLLHAYLLSNSQEVDINRVRPAVIICPGGAYAFRSDRENECVAVRLNALGLHAFVVDYSVAPVPYPAALTQTLLAVALVRENAAQWGVQADKIAVMGFSAGGHLAASACTLYDDAEILSILHRPAAQIRPSAGILCYPVIETGKFGHEGSFRNLLGARYDTDVQKQSLQLRVNANTPPTFIFHTFEDAAVPVENALDYARALREAGVPFEMHIYQRGGHGLSLANEEVFADGGTGGARPDIRDWPDIAAHWLRDL